MDIVQELKKYSKSLIALAAAEKAAQVAQKARDKAWREYYILRDQVNSTATQLGFDEDEEIGIVKKLEFKTPPRKAEVVEIDSDEETRTKKKAKLLSTK